MHTYKYTHTHIPIYTPYIFLIYTHTCQQPYYTTYTTHPSECEDVTCEKQYYNSKMKGGFRQAQSTVQFLLGPVKIKDGLFMGDELSARDFQFIMSNKVTHVINTVSRVVPNVFEKYGVQYLSVHWSQKEQNIFDKKNNAVNAIFNFVQEAAELGESCLIHSQHGKSRACAVLIAYLMRKYTWSLNKSLEFVVSKKEGLEIRANFLTQLQELEKRLLEQNKLSSGWHQVKNQEDLVLANTFHNSHKHYSKESTYPKRTNSKRVAWAEKMITPIKPQLNSTLTRFREEDKPVLRSILKGDQEEQQQHKESQAFINSINGNIVHVTVNNFITTEKKAETMYNTRPFSSDNKQRSIKYENPVMKNPYDMKGSKLGTRVRKEPIKNPVVMSGYDRPQSAGINADRRKPKIVLEQMIIMGVNRRRNPSTNPKDDPYKWK